MRKRERRSIATMPSRPLADRPRLQPVELPIPERDRRELLDLAVGVERLTAGSVYLIGSATTGEGLWTRDRNDSSDLDLLVVVPSLPPATILRDLQDLVRGPHRGSRGRRFGVRVRETSELGAFARRMRSWGYSLGQDALVLCGAPVELPEDPGYTGLGALMNNWLERAWLDVSRAVFGSSGSSRDLACSAMDALTLGLLRLGIFEKTHADRIERWARVSRDLPAHRQLAACLEWKLGRDALPVSPAWARSFFRRQLATALAAIRATGAIEGFGEASFGAYLGAQIAGRSRDAAAQEVLRVVFAHLRFLLPLNETARLALSGSELRRALRAAANALLELEGTYLLGRPGAIRGDLGELLTRYALLRLAMEPLARRDHSRDFELRLGIDARAIPPARARAVDA